jgi:Tfp pilus assembly protein PilO
MNEKQKSILGYVILVAAILGLGALHYTKLKERGQLQAEIDRYTKQAKDAQEKIQAVPDLRAKRDRLASFIDEYMEILPKEEHVQHDAFVDTIDSYRKDTGIVIREAAYVEIKEKKERKKKRGKGDETEKQKDFIRHRYRFRLEGTVPDLIEFVEKIENHARFLKVDALEIKPFGAKGDFTGSGTEKEEMELLALAANERKEIELTVSTYTYYKGSQQNPKKS